MIRIHTIDGESHKTSDVDLDHAVTLLADSNAVFDVFALQRGSREARRAVIPVRSVAWVSGDPQ